MQKCTGCPKTIDWGNKQQVPVTDHHGDHVSVFCTMECRADYMTRTMRRSRSRSWLLVAGILVIIGVAFKAWGAPPPNASGHYTQWYLEQQQLDEEPVCNRAGECHLKSCCGGPEEEGGDGRSVNVRYVGHDDTIGDRYEVEINGVWILYPRPVPRALDNPTGRNVAWLRINTDGSVTWYCLRVALGV